MDIVARRFEVAGWLKAAAAIEAELRQLTKGLTEAQFHAPTRTGEWSIGYCIEHLVLTGHAYIPKWDLAMRNAAHGPLIGDTPFPYAWWQRRMLQYAENPSKMKRKTAASFVPYSRRSIEDTVSRFIEMHKQVGQRVLQCRGLAVGQIQVQSPFISWMHYALGFSFDLALAHERRHLQQARQVRQQLEV